jgi:hypothetical protein
VLGQHFGPVMREFDLREQHVQGQAVHRGRAYRVSDPRQKRQKRPKAPLPSRIADIIPID